MRGDAHTHFISLDFIKHLEGRSTLSSSALEGGTYFTTCAQGFRLPILPRTTDMEVKLKDIEDMSVDLSVLSIRHSALSLLWASGQLCGL